MIVSKRVMSGQKHDFSGGFLKGTRLLALTGEWVCVEDIKVGDKLMSLNGEPCEVAAVPRATADTLCVTQASGHYAHLRDPTRTPPWGLVEFTCTRRQELLILTTQVVKNYNKSRECIRKVAVNQPRPFRTPDGRVINIIQATGKTFPLPCDEEAVDQYIEECTRPYLDKIIKCKCEVGDLRHLNKDVLASSTLVVSPLSFERPVMLPWLKEKFQRDVTLKELEGMAWLLGFWIGDGYRRAQVYGYGADYRA